MNAEVFEGLPELQYVRLQNNECINSYAEPDTIGKLLKTVKTQCGFYEGALLSEISCGNAAYFSSFIVGGEATKRGQWPFLAALTLASNGKFFCGANLISSKHVLTAAHCIHEKREVRQFNSKDISVLLGRHNLREANERGAVSRGVKEIFIHPGWSNDTEKYDSDLAILTLDRAVEFTDFIQPVCLSSDDAMLKTFDGIVASSTHFLVYPELII